MSYKGKIETPTFSFIFNEKLELNLKAYIGLRKSQEISGGLLGDIKGGKKNQIIFDIKEFLPFPNLAENTRKFVIPPKSWFDVLKEWRLFYFKDYKFIGFLHTHPESSSKISGQDLEFAYNLKEKYGSIIFIILGENKTLRCYLFNSDSFSLISGHLKFYRLLEK